MSLLQDSDFVIIGVILFIYLFILWMQYVTRKPVKDETSI